jgi:L-asparaginase/Glu-tRNA(Gln) amidotransferase subunit D
MAYPSIPPKTEPTVATRATRQTLFLSAMKRGIVITSMGMGRIALSAKETRASAHKARLVLALLMVHWYSRSKLRKLN